MGVMEICRFFYEVPINSSNWISLQVSKSPNPKPETLKPLTVNQIQATCHRGIHVRHLGGKDERQ